MFAGVPAAELFRVSMPPQGYVEEPAGKQCRDSVPPLG